MKRPELLSPAGTRKGQRYALAYGADAVYAGMPRYSLRVRNNDYQLENLAEGIDDARALGKQFYVAANVLPHNAKVRTFMDDMTPVAEMAPDAFIMADPGLIMMVRERWPDIPVHLSVQANTMNSASVRFWQQVGIKRIILSRELSLDEIEAIRNECPEMELEVFVHGALCIAYSGRCLLSGYFNHRDPNQGTCTNSCRWDYKLHETEQDLSGDIHARPVAGTVEDVYLLEEKERSGEMMPVMEDEHGTYIMNSRDLRAVQHVARLTELGIDSLKIEGRTKSHYYAARTAQVYRRAIDDAVAGRPFDEQSLAILENLANRGYTDGFYQRHHTQAEVNYMENISDSYQQRFVGEIAGYDDARGMAVIEVKNRFSVGDSMELISPASNETFRLDYMEDLKGQQMETAPGSGHRVRIPVPVAADELGLLARNL